MKTNIIGKLLIAIVFTTFLSACNLFDKNDDNPKPEDKYLVAFEEGTTYTPSVIQLFLNNFMDEYPELQTIYDNLDYGIKIYSISYLTTFNGEERIASGLVSVPIQNGSYPILSYQNGTNTLHSNAPSVNYDTPFNNPLYLMLEFVASNGFIVCVPDYLGFGTSSDMFHPYLHAESTIKSVTDMWKAVEELANNYLNIETNNDLFISGYSQGGWATMQLQKAIEDGAAPGLKLKASACGAGPYDLKYINNYVLAQETYPMPYFLGYIFNSYLELGSITAPVGDIFQAPYDQRIQNGELYNGTFSGSEINAKLNTDISKLFTADYIANSATDSKFSSVISSLEANSISAWNTSTPTMISYGTADDLVPPQVSIDIYNSFIEQGVLPTDVILVPLEGKDHIGGAIPSGIAAINWFISMRQP